ncbi:hypothetical protein [Massilia sp. METH4]|uniref:hypothetical protein n=1 Tax=Massilia sp. METH4 TaxID=3123041 RepID=UPI0030D21A64
MWRGRHAPRDLATALRNAMRQTPDCSLIREIRDRAMIRSRQAGEAERKPAPSEASLTEFTLNA